jgi:hypothetical protein
MQTNEWRHSIEQDYDTPKIGALASGVHRLSKLHGQTAAAREKPMNPACDTWSEA